mmetsp:Transcript_10744/g.32296  ORF Transcript_10744/g.32296 Transcript_10744/m.32296 type:complete len:337 (-) Transcript_10744:804-1814(-)
MGFRREVETAPDGAPAAFDLGVSQVLRVVVQLEVQAGVRVRAGAPRRLQVHADLGQQRRRHEPRDVAALVRRAAELQRRHRLAQALRVPHEVLELRVRLLQVQPRRVVLRVEADLVKDLRNLRQVVLPVIVEVCSGVVAVEVCSGVVGGGRRLGGLGGVVVGSPGAELGADVAPGVEPDVERLAHVQLHLVERFVVAELGLDGVHEAVHEIVETSEGLARVAERSKRRQNRRGAVRRDAPSRSRRGRRHPLRSLLFRRRRRLFPQQRELVVGVVVGLGAFLAADVDVYLEGLLDVGLGSAQEVLGLVVAGAVQHVDVGAAPMNEGDEDRRDVAFQF